jgi:hypothetical protein
MEQKFHMQINENEVLRMDMEEISAAYKNLSKQNENLKVIHVLHEY